MHTTANFTLLDDDIAFRYLFKEKDILEDFVNSFLEYVNIPRVFYSYSSKFHKDMLADTKNIRVFYGDVVVTLDNEDILDIELYKDTFNLNKYNKSCSYMCRLYGSQLKRGDNDYTKCRKVISLNLIRGNFRRINADLINLYGFNNIVSRKRIDNGNLEMYLVRLDMVKTIHYNENEKRFIKWLRLINAKSLEEMKSIGKDDAIMENSIRVITEWNEEKCQTNWDDYIDEIKFDSKSEGKKEGKKEERLNIAKSMIQKNMAVSEIADITKLSIKEINKLIA